MPSNELEDRLTLRAALLESNNAAAADLQQRIFVDGGPAPRVGRRAARSARRAVAGARDRARDAARSDGRLCDFSRRRRIQYAARRAVGLRRRRRRGVLAAGADAKSVISPQVAFQMVSMLRDVVDRGTGSPARALGVRGAVGGKDRHDRRLSRRVVRRLLVVGRGRRVGGLRSAGDDRPRGVRGASRVADLGRFHEADRSDVAPGGIRGSRRGWKRESCAACRICGRFRVAQPTRSISSKATPYQTTDVRSIRGRCPIRRSGSSAGCSNRSAARSRESFGDDEDTSLGLALPALQALRSRPKAE